MVNVRVSGQTTQLSLGLQVLQIGIVGKLIKGLSYTTQHLNKVDACVIALRATATVPSNSTDI